jgi:aminoglycoside phosphotransferase (APT) family kinase protein
VTLIEDAALPHEFMLVHAYVNGAPAPLTTVSPAAMQALGTCLSWVHTHPRSGYMLWPSLAVHHGTRAACFRARVAALHHFGSTAGILQEVDTLLDRLAAIDLPASAGWEEPGFALIHGDLSLGNILYRADDTVALIDWEYARDGDPAEDLAYLIAEQDPPPAVIADLADAYVNASGDPWAFARVPAWLPLVALDSALWWTSHLLQRAEPLDNPIIRTHLDRARRYVGS